MTAGPEYTVQITDSYSGILIFQWHGYAKNEQDALAQAENQLLSESAPC